MKADTFQKRFWSKVLKSDYCWNWIGSRNKAGYGRLMMKQGGVFLAHRLIWTEEKGNIPDGMCVLHRCDNPSCIRLDHLFLGTQQDNIRDAQNKGRRRWAWLLYGKDAKISAEDVLSMRSEYKPFKFTQPMLAKKYGLPLSKVNSIINKKSFAWLHTQ